MIFLELEVGLPTRNEGLGLVLAFMVYFIMGRWLRGSLHHHVLFIEIHVTLPNVRNIKVTI